MPFVLPTEIIGNYYHVIISSESEETHNHFMTSIPSHLIEVREKQCHQLLAASREGGLDLLTWYRVQFTKKGDSAVNLQVFLLGPSLLLVLVILEVPKTEKDDYACKIHILQMFLF